MEGWEDNKIVKKLNEDFFIRIDDPLEYLDNPYSEEPPCSEETPYPPHHIALSQLESQFPSSRILSASSIQDLYTSVDRQGRFLNLVDSTL